MSTEQIYKLQPDRTLYLRGFTGFGAAASLCRTSPTGFTVCGVFRDMADFCVLMIYDADNTFEHYSVRYLPDFELSGMVLTFDVNYGGLQPLDSAKYPWIDWSQLDVIKADGTTQQVRLWDYATLLSGNYSVAQGTFSLIAPGGCRPQDRLTLFINNTSFDFVAAGGESAGTAAQAFASSINQYDWSTYSNHSISVIATADSAGNLTLKNARTGHVNVTGASVTWVDGIRFPGITAGSMIYLGGNAHTVSAVNSPTSLELTVPGSSGTNVVYLAEYGGLDGNSVTVYMLAAPGNVSLTVKSPVLSLAGGNSENVIWRITLDFTALGINQLRQAWLTFAPQLTAGSNYKDTEWNATFSNWTVQAPNNNRALKCAGPGSVRIGNDQSQACTYSGSGWTTIAANNYWRGFARTTANAGDSLIITYDCPVVHDLYLGTCLDKKQGAVSVSLDGDSSTQQSCYVNIDPKTESSLMARRVLRRSVAAGTHTLTLTTLDANPFLFDYLEAAVPGDIPDPVVVYPNVSPALDFDTDATYKVSPQRLLWHLSKLGFAGQINEYLGVFWWNQRARVNGVWNSAVVNFGGAWAAGDTAILTIGNFAFRKAVNVSDTLDTIAAHFVYYINAASVSMRAEKTGSGQLKICTRTPNWGDSFTTAKTSAFGTIQTSGNLNVGSDGTWQVDPAAANPLNYPVRQWHADFFNSAAALSLPVTTSFSMELVNPPDDGTAANIWQARYFDGTPVETATGFSSFLSFQCAPVANLTNYQKAVFTAMAGLQSAAGLIPWLQFGEFLWWFYSSMAQPVGYCAYTDPISIGLAQPHGMQTGDRVVITGVEGCTAANGTWVITVTDPTHFTIPVSANGAWITNTGQMRGGSMAYYDPVTAATAQAALGRPLRKFTCQDDDPTVNGGVDAQFLAAQLKAHVDAIRGAVLAQYSSAKFEVLYPNDVNNPVCYLGANVPYPQGGRLNAAVNLPAAWMTKPDSGLDRFKVEALSWSAQYLNLDLATQAISFALTPQLSWNASDVAYLVPWFNGTCPWPYEFQTASALGLASINFWAYDHLALMSWPLPLPAPVRRSFRAA